MVVDSKELDQPPVLIDTDPDTGTYRATYHFPSQPPSTTVTLALMEITDSSVTDLPPMHDAASLNTDALDDLFNLTSDGDCPEGCVSFTYLNYTVKVKGHGRIVIQSPDISTDARS